jgi:enoyl-[acyl-carrier protein] reductase I
MGLLDGKRALIFGLANDHSIAWGIAQAFHREGAEVGFSSVDMLIDKRVRPLAEQLGSTFVEPCDVQSDTDIERVFARWREVYGDEGSLDILVHAVAFANKDELSGEFIRTSREGFHLAHDVSAP